MLVEISSYFCEKKCDNWLSTNKIKCERPVAEAHSFDNFRQQFCPFKEPKVYTVLSYLTSFMKFLRVRELYYIGVWISYLFYYCCSKSSYSKYNLFSSRLKMPLKFLLFVSLRDRLIYLYLHINWPLPTNHIFFRNQGVCDLLYVTEVIYQVYILDCKLAREKKTANLKGI